MQKYLILFTINVLISFNTYSQKLEGEWKGIFGYRFLNYQTPITLFINLKSDSTYDVHSYTTFKSQNGCDSVVVDQLNIIPEENGWFIFKTIYLNYNDYHGISMGGAWKTIDETYPNSGAIILHKILH